MSVLSTPGRPSTAASTAASSATSGGDGASVDASTPPTAFGAPTTDPALLEARIVGAASLMQRARHRLVTALAAYDDSGAWALTGAHTCAQWVADRLGVHAGTAREWLRVGHALARLPRLDAAVADGSLTYGAARALTRVALDHPEHEHELLELAGRTRPADLSKALAAWAMGHDTDEQRADRERSQTCFSARVEADGMGTIHVRLPAIDMGRIQAAVDARVMQARPRRTEPEAAPDRSRRWPSLGAQRAHALVELLTGAGPGDRAASGGTSVSVATEVIVHVRADGCTLHDGTPLAASTVASLLDDAFVRMLIHDAESRPVNASVRRRHPTTRQKRVVDERHPCCVDCGATDLLEYDHDPAYPLSQRTHTDELYPRCSRCHRRRHRRQGA